jgi:hypothetical protein
MRNKSRDRDISTRTCTYVAVELTKHHLSIVCFEEMMGWSRNTLLYACRRTVRIREQSSAWVQLKINCSSPNDNLESLTIISIHCLSITYTGCSTNSSRVETYSVSITTYVQVVLRITFVAACNKSKQAHLHIFASCALWIPAAWLVRVHGVR